MGADLDRLNNVTWHTPDDLADARLAAETRRQLGRSLEDEWRRLEAEALANARRPARMELE